MLPYFLALTGIVAGTGFLFLAQPLLTACESQGKSNLFCSVKYIELKRGKIYFVARLLNLITQHSLEFK